MQSHCHRPSGLWTKLFFSTTFQCQIRFLKVLTRMCPHEICSDTQWIHCETIIWIHLLCRSECGHVSSASLVPTKDVLKPTRRHKKWISKLFGYLFFLNAMLDRWRFHTYTDGTSECMGLFVCGTPHHIERAPENCIKSKILNPCKYTVTQANENFGGF